MYTLVTWVFTDLSLLHGSLDLNVCLKPQSFRFISELSGFMTSSDLKHSWFTHLTQRPIVIQLPFLFTTETPPGDQQCVWRLLRNVTVHPKMTLSVCISVRFRKWSVLLQRALNSNSQRSLWKYVRNAGWAAGKAARMCFCGDWDFTSPETGSIRHSNQTLWDYWEL